MKIKYYLAGILILIVAIIGYHYYAASRAASQIDEALQEQAQKSENRFSVKYSAINVHPFSGDIDFRDFNLIQSDFIYRAELIHFNLTYLDFMTIYWGGAEQGLRKISRVRAAFSTPAIIYRDSVRELKGDLLNLMYEGNMYDMLRHSVTGVPLENEHQLEVSSRNFRLRQPDSGWGGFTADSIYLQTRLSAGALSLVNTDHLLSKAVDVTWQPSEEIQEKYGFFIRGFGYDTESVPVDSILFMLNSTGEIDRKQMNLDLHTELFHAQAVAEIRLHSPATPQFVFEDGTVNLIETSQQFDTFLRNAEKLFGITLPRRSERVLQFSGPLTDPQFTSGNRSESQRSN